MTSICHCYNNQSTLVLNFIIMEPTPVNTAKCTPIVVDSKYTSKWDSDKWDVTAVGTKSDMNL